jgi:hypothetical protein
MISLVEEMLAAERQGLTVRIFEFDDEGMTRPMVEVKSAAGFRHRYSLQIELARQHAEFVTRDVEAAMYVRQLRESIAKDMKLAQLPGQRSRLAEGAKNASLLGEIRAANRDGWAVTFFDEESATILCLHNLGGTYGIQERLTPEMESMFATPEDYGLLAMNRLRQMLDRARLTKDPSPLKCALGEIVLQAKAAT